jgi:two-component system OmpR family sensor kinase
MGIRRTVADMTIKRRILLTQIVLGTAIAVLVGVSLSAIASLSAALERNTLSHRQMAASLQLAAAANEYSEQVAEILLVGEPERPDLEKSRKELTRLLNEGYDLSMRELATIPEPERAGEQREAARLEEARAVVQRTDRAVERLLLIAKEGRHDEAVALYRSEIEDRLDADLGRLIDATVADERAEVAQTLRQIETLVTRLLWVTGGAAFLALTIAVLLGGRLAQAISVPLGKLGDGAQAIGRGDLSHRVEVDRPDEFGTLARSFNAMAAELERQRNELTSSHARLESEVERRTRDLAESNRRLVELDRQRVEFLTDLSHELRTPLTIIRGEAEVALRSGTTAGTGASDVLEAVVGQAAAMSRLVEDLLFLARSEADDIRFSFEPIRLAELIREAIDDATVLARRRGTSVAHVASAPDVVLFGDARRLKQVLLIALDNAVKYGGTRGTVEITDRIDGSHVVVSIANSAPDLDDQDLATLFDRFTRGRVAQAQGVAGSGLGLSIARRIVQRHAGTITFDRGLGSKVVLSIRLPLHPERR